MALMMGYVGWVQMNGVTLRCPGCRHCSTALHGCRLQSPATRCSAMVSNVTTLVCDIVPLWSGYIWLAQVGTIQHYTDMITSASDNSSVSQSVFTIQSRRKPLL